MTMNPARARLRTLTQFALLAMSIAFCVASVRAEITPDVLTLFITHAKAGNASAKKRLIVERAYYETLRQNSLSAPGTFTDQDRQLLDRIEKALGPEAAAGDTGQAGAASSAQVSVSDASRIHHPAMGTGSSPAAGATRKRPDADQCFAKGTIDVDCLIHQSDKAEIEAAGAASISDLGGVRVLVDADAGIISAHPKNYLPMLIHGTVVAIAGSEGERHRFGISEPGKVYTGWEGSMNYTPLRNEKELELGRIVGVQDGRGGKFAFVFRKGIGIPVPKVGQAVSIIGLFLGDTLRARAKDVAVDNLAPGIYLEATSKEIILANVKQNGINQQKQMEAKQAAVAAQRAAADKLSGPHRSHQQVGMTQNNDQEFISVIQSCTPKFTKSYRLDAGGIGTVFSESGLMSGQPSPGYRAILVSAMHSGMGQMADYDAEAGHEVSRESVGDRLMIQVRWRRPVNSLAPVLLQTAVFRSAIDLPLRRYLWIVGVFSGESVELANAYGEHSRVPVIDLLAALGENQEPNSINGYNPSDQFVYSYDDTLINSL